MSEHPSYTLDDSGRLLHDSTPPPRFDDPSEERAVTSTAPPPVAAPVAAPTGTVVSGDARELRARIRELSQEEAEYRELMRKTPASGHLKLIDQLLPVTRERLALEQQLTAATPKPGPEPTSIHDVVVEEQGPPLRGELSQPYNAEWNVPLREKVEAAAEKVGLSAFGVLDTLARESRHGMHWTAETGVADLERRYGTEGTAEIIDNVEAALETLRKAEPDAAKWFESHPLAYNPLVLARLAAAWKNRRAR